MRIEEEESSERELILIIQLVLKETHFEYDFIVTYLLFSLFKRMG